MRLGLAVFLLGLLTPDLGLAQYGAIAGRVTDGQGGALPGATVVATHLATGIETNTVTNAAGAFFFSSLQRGDYRLSIAMPGFQTVIREGIVLQSGRNLRVDVTLELAPVAETLTVSAETPMIPFRESEVSGIVENVQIENIPINTRDTQQLALLVPGAKPANRFDPTKGRVPAISFGTNGTGRGILYTLDGGDNTDDVVGGIVQQVSMDSIEEFEVVTARMSAEYSRAAGGVIKLVTKSGTNEFRGSVFEFFRDRSLNAKTQPEKDAGIDKAPFRRHQFGGHIGGPIVKNKAFFFFSLERIVEDVNSVLSLPADVEPLYDPAFLDAHGGLGVILQPYRRTYGTFKYTHEVSAANRLDVRVALEDNRREGDQIGTGFTVNNTRDQSATQTNDLVSVLGRFQTLAGSSGFNEAVFQVTDFENVIQSDLQPDFVSPGSPTLWYPSLTLGQRDSAPQRTFQRKYQFRDDFSWSLDTHDFKFGGDALRIEPAGFHVPFGTQGGFEYANDGDPTDAAIWFSQLSYTPPIELPNTQYGLYFQDDWRVAPALTLNLGVRYDLEIGAISSVQYGSSGALLLEDPRSPYFGYDLPEDDKNNIAPRLGFAWDVGGRGDTVVRGGWGLFYDKVLLNATGLGAFDAVDGTIVAIENPPFGPDNIPPFDLLADELGFTVPASNIITPDYVLPRSSQASLGVSRQFGPDLALDVDFVTAKGTSVGKRLDLNERSVPFENSSRRFWPEIGGPFQVTAPAGENGYNGLQVSLRRRFSGGLQYVFNYTLSRLSGFANAFGDRAECLACVGDARDTGPLPNDTTHRFVASGIASLPGELQVSALFQAETGRPVTARVFSDPDGNGVRTDFVEGPNGEPAGRGNVRGEPTLLLDLRIVRSFRFDDKELHLIFEAFNVFDRVNWGSNLIDDGNSPAFGQWSGELSTNQREIQLGIRFSF